MLQPMQSSVVVATSSSQPFNKSPSVPFNQFVGRYSTFADKSVDHRASKLHSSAQCAEAPSPMSSHRDCFSVVSERSTPLKPAKRDRPADDDDRQILRCKRSLASSLNTVMTATARPDGGSQQQQQSSLSESVERRNLRERRRVKLINVTFATLRNRLPSYCWQQRQHHHQQQQQQQQRRDRRQRLHGVDGGGSMKRPSKVDTLKTAISYIRCLQDLLADDDRRQRLMSTTTTTFQTFDLDAAATNTVDFIPDCSPHPWATSPAAVHAGYARNSCSPLASLPPSSPSEDLTTTTTTSSTAAIRFNNHPDLNADETLDRRRDVLSPLPSDLLDWLV